MKRTHKKYEYRLRRVARDDRGNFTIEKESRVIDESYAPKGKLLGKRLAEYVVRSTSRAHPRQLVSLWRNGVLLVCMVNGRVVDPAAIDDPRAQLKELAQKTKPRSTNPMTLYRSTGIMTRERAEDIVTRLLSEHAPKFLEITWRGRVTAGESFVDELLVSRTTLTD